MSETAAQAEELNAGLWIEVSFEEGTSGPILTSSGIMIEGDDDAFILVMIPSWLPENSIGGDFVQAIPVHRVVSALTFQLEDMDREDDIDLVASIKAGEAIKATQTMSAE